MAKKSEKKASTKKAANGRPQVATKSFKALDIRRNFPPDQKAIYANNFVVQHEQSVFSLLFFEVVPPLLLEEGEELKKKIESMTHIDANCVARIIMPASIMPQVMEALQENFQKHKAKTASEPIKINGETATK